MKKSKIALWVSLLLVAMVVLAGCAPRVGAGNTAAMAGGDELVVDLPAIVIDFDSAGSPSIGNVPVAQMGGMLGVDLSTLAMDSSMIDFLTASNMQHLQVNNHPDGLLLLVNGEPVPSLAWDGESLSATAEVLAALGVAIPVLDQVLPLVDNLGLGVIVRFPVGAGADLVPLYVEGDGSAAAAASAAQEEFLAAVGAPPVINLPVFYAADGSWTVGDLSGAEWSALTGAPWTMANLQPAIIDTLASAGVKQLDISTNPEGIHIAINGKALPALTWGNGEITHLLGLADQMALWDSLAPGVDMGEIMGTIEALLPVIQVADTNISVFFPDSSMAVK